MKKSKMSKDRLKYIIHILKKKKKTLNAENYTFK